jgi:hypothetical protein
MLNRRFHKFGFIKKYIACGLVPIHSLEDYSQNEIPISTLPASTSQVIGKRIF